MDNYQKQLALLYFYTAESEYSLLELKQLLGLQQNQLDLILSELKKDEFICIKDYQIAVTEKGILHLISNNISSNADETGTYVFKNIMTQNLKPLDEPYVPKNFLAKI